MPKLILIDEPGYDPLNNGLNEDHLAKVRAERKRRNLPEPKLNPFAMRLYPNVSEIIFGEFKGNEAEKI